MMSADKRFEYAVSVVLKHEGAFADDELDSGGATNYGISLRYLKISGIDINLDGRIDITDILAIDKSKAKAIYKKYWWEKYGYNSIDDLLVATKAFDLAINMGTIQANKLIQRAVNKINVNKLIVDGKLGKKSIAAINDCGKLGHNDELLSAIKNQASEFYKNLVEKKPHLSVFLNGWLKRAND